jgi:hypothetical protein
MRDQVSHPHKRGDYSFIHFNLEVIYRRPEDKRNEVSIFQIYCAFLLEEAKF